jgi:hypothetical protein
MGPISVVVQDSNNLTLEVTPTPSTTVILDRGIPGPAGDGDVDGPASSTDNALVRFDGTTGKLIQNSVGILSDAGALTGLTSVDTTNLEVTNVKALDGTASFAIANTTGVFSIDDTKFTLQDNADTTKKALFELSGITTATTRTYTLPNATGTLATLANTSQTFTGSTLFVPATNSGTITIGGIPQTGTITVDRSQATHTLDVGVGPTLSGNTKTINFGTAGVSGSITNIIYGSSISGATVTHTFNSGTRQMQFDANGLTINNGSFEVKTGPIIVYCPTPSTITATATLTNSDIQAQIINTTGAAAYTVTLPLGTDLETLISWDSVDIGYDFYLINSVPAIITIAANTGVTIVGRTLVATNISAQFRIRRTAANTFIVYRIN